MTDANTSLQADAADSQVIQPTDALEHGRTSHMPEEQPKPEVTDEKPSLRSAIEKAIDGAKEKPEPVKADAEKVEDKPAKVEAVKEAPAEPVKKEVKAEADEPETEDQAATRQPKQAEPVNGKQYTDPPSRFLPEARTKWANVPNEIKAEFHRVTEEVEREVAEHRQFREELREYEDLAKQHGVTIKDTMQRYVAADRVLNQNFGQGVAQMAQMYGHNPAQAIASVIAGFGITPQQYVQAITHNPSLAMVAQQSAPQQQQGQAAPDPIRSEVEELRAELNSMKIESTVVPVVQSFAQAHPDFDALSPQIKGILDSGVLNKLYGDGLTYEQKLAEAYRMAGGRGAPSIQEPEATAAHSEDSNRLVDPDGKKSIKGAPSSGQNQQRRTFKSNREALESLFPR